MYKFSTIKNGFTLSEILIALVITGVIAAITVPQILQNTQKKELQAALIKTYSELNQIARKFSSDYGVSVSDYSYTNGISQTNKVIAKYYRSSESLSSRWGTDDGSGNYTAYYTMHLLNREKFSGGTNTNGGDSSFLCDDAPFQSQTNGAIYILNNAGSETRNGPVICVDINGQRGPNRYGVDYFLFIFTVDNKVIPVGQSHDNNPGTCVIASGSCPNFNNVGSEYCSKTSSNVTYNTSCAYYALLNKHPTIANKNYWGDFI